MIKENLRPYDVEYIDEVHRRLKDGGILYFIERTDTNDFLVEKINNTTGCFNSQYTNEDRWLKSIPTLPKMLFSYTTAHYYLTKEDAEHTNKCHFSEGGCQHCGHGSKSIPTIVTEHLFID